MKKRRGRGRIEESGGRGGEEGGRRRVLVTKSDQRTALGQYMHHIQLTRHTLTHTLTHVNVQLHIQIQTCTHTYQNTQNIQYTHTCMCAKDTEDQSLSLCQYCIARRRET